MRKLSTLGTVFLLVAAAAQSAYASDWPISTPSREGLDQARLTQLDARVRAALPHVRSLLIARHGSLVFEHYYGDASPEKLHNIQSMTKSVSSALVGIALKKGLIKSLDNRALDYYPEYQSAIADQRVREITIRHLRRQQEPLTVSLSSRPLALVSTICPYWSAYLLAAARSRRGSSAVGRGP